MMSTSVEPPVESGSHLPLSGLPRASSPERAYAVLVESFVGSIEARCGALLAGSEVNRLSLLAALNGSGLPFADGRGPDRLTLGKALSADSAILDRGPGDRSGGSPVESVLAVAPVRTLGAPIGLLWADIEPNGGLDENRVRWRAEAYASVAALCLTGDDVFASAIAAVGIDELTGCLNYAGLCDRLDTELDRASRSGAPLSCAFLDLDDFKGLNDRAGHLVGNAILAGVGSTLLDALRTYDIAARFGGDEFVIILPETGLGEATLIAERAGRRSVAAVSSDEAEVSISVGVAQWDRAGSAADLLDAADRSLQIAKNSRVRR